MSGGGFGPPGALPPAAGGPRFGPPPGAAIQLVPGAVVERNSAMVIVLALVTCGLYMFWWLYQTTEELRVATNDQSLNPMMDLLLIVVTCGLWGMFVEYRNAQKIHQALVGREPNREDKSNMVLMMNVLALFVGVTGLFATYMVQEELNLLSRAAR